jgi:hypothetical protein
MQFWCGVAAGMMVGGSLGALLMGIIVGGKFLKSHEWDER